jgi:flavin reductase (DIM6/NTAB) family NADH-FMN oxidoreductase RutF
MQIDPKEVASREVYAVMISAIVPRPIAFVSTRSIDGITNLAPFSYFNGVASKPPLISISIGHRRYEGKVVKKDTLQNIEETREFVVNVATLGLLSQINQSSAEYPPEVSEIEELQLETLPSVKVTPPRIKASPVQLECRLERVVMLGEPALNGLVIGEVVYFHIDDSVWDPARGSIDPEKLSPIARLGGALYTTLGRIISLPRP